MNNVELYNLKYFVIRDFVDFYKLKTNTDKK